MVLPESCSSDQQVMGKERGLQGEEQPRLHREKTLFSTSKEKGGEKPQQYTQKHWPSSAQSWHIGSLWVEEKLGQLASPHISHQKRGSKGIF